MEPLDAGQDRKDLISINGTMDNQPTYEIISTAESKEQSIHPTSLYETFVPSQHQDNVAKIYEPIRNVDRFESFGLGSTASLADDSTSDNDQPSRSASSIGEENHSRIRSLQSNKLQFELPSSSLSDSRSSSTFDINQIDHDPVGSERPLLSSTTSNPKDDLSGTGEDVDDNDGEKPIEPIDYEYEDMDDGGDFDDRDEDNRENENSDFTMTKFPSSQNITDSQANKSPSNLEDRGEEKIPSTTVNYDSYERETSTISRVSLNDTQGSNFALNISNEDDDISALNQSQQNNPNDENDGRPQFSSKFQNRIDDVINHSNDYANDFRSDLNRNQIEIPMSDDHRKQTPMTLKQIEDRIDLIEQLKKTKKVLEKQIEKLKFLERNAFRSINTNNGIDDDRFRVSFLNSNQTSPNASPDSIEKSENAQSFEARLNRDQLVNNETDQMSTKELVTSKDIVPEDQKKFKDAFESDQIESLPPTTVSTPNNVELSKEEVSDSGEKFLDYTFIDDNERDDVGGDGRIKTKDPNDDAANATNRKSDVNESNDEIGNDGNDHHSESPPTISDFYGDNHDRFDRNDVAHRKDANDVDVAHRL
ncbi:hypothetical protein QR98_0074400 [Sarcoptes scabiei]|uniref:Uncharacterized protein n=1 Tax=Sarcoptes scabiei TaxID=52283 RepID=A0A132AD43_SARSC|nr:hypothetical protein QR98_0074400 [Sarcoptes scabiei]